MAEEYRRAVAGLLGDSRVPPDHRKEFRRVLFDCESLIGRRYMEPPCRGQQISAGFSGRFSTATAVFWCGVARALESFGDYEEREGVPLNLPRHEALRKLIRSFAIGGGLLPEKSLEEKATTQESIGNALYQASRTLEREPFFKGLSCDDLAVLDPLEKKRKECEGRIHGELWALRDKYADASRADIPAEMLGLLSAFEEYVACGWKSKTLGAKLEELAFQAEASAAMARLSHRTRKHPEILTRHYWSKGATRFRWRVSGAKFPPAPFCSPGSRISVEGLDAKQFSGVLYSDFEPLPPDLSHRSQKEPAGDKIKVPDKVFAKALLDWFKHDCGRSSLPRGVRTEISFLSGVPEASLKNL